MCFYLHPGAGDFHEPSRGNREDSAAAYWIYNIDAFTFIFLKTEQLLNQLLELRRILPFIKQLSRVSNKSLVYQGYQKWEMELFFLYSKSMHGKGIAILNMCLVLK